MEMSTKASMPYWLTQEEGMSMTSPSTPRKRRATKHDQPIKINATPEEVARTLFAGKPKPSDQWRYLKPGSKPLQ